MSHIGPHEVQDHRPSAVPALDVVHKAMQAVMMAMVDELVDVQVAVLMKIQAEELGGIIPTML